MNLVDIVIYSQSPLSHVKIQLDVGTTRTPEVIQQ